MSQTRNYCEPLVAVWLRPSTTEPCTCCKQVAENPRGEHLKMMYDVCMYVKCARMCVVLVLSLCTNARDNLFEIDRSLF